MKLLPILFLFLFVSCGSFQENGSYRELSSQKYTSLEELDQDLKNIKNIVDQSLDIYLPKRTEEQKTSGFSRIEYEISEKVEFKVYIPLDEMKHLHGIHRNRKRRLNQLVKELYGVSLKRIMAKKGADKNLPRKIDIQYLETIKN